MRRMKCQKTIDARSYSHQALEEIRISVVHLAVAGESPYAVDTLFNPNNSLGRHSREGGNPAIKTCRKADKTKVLSHLRGNLLINWIPACAGMTQFWLMDNSG